MSHPSPDTLFNRLSDAFVGLSAVSFGLITSFQDELESVLRIISLLIGVSIGAVTLYRTIKKQ